MQSFGEMSARYKRNSLCANNIGVEILHVLSYVAIEQVTCPYLNLLIIIFKCSFTAQDESFWLYHCISTVEFYCCNYPNSSLNCSSGRIILFVTFFEGAVDGHFYSSSMKFCINILSVMPMYISSFFFIGCKSIEHVFWLHEWCG